MTDKERLEEIEMFAFEISKLVELNVDVLDDIGTSIHNRINIIKNNAKYILNSEKKEDDDFGVCVNPENVDNVITALEDDRNLMQNNINGIKNASIFLKEIMLANEAQIFQLENLRKKHKNKIAQ